MLPLLAASLLLLALIWPQIDWRGSYTEESLPQSFSDVELRDIRMVRARLVGTDEQGRPFTVTADEVRQADGLMKHATFVRPRARLRLAEGRVIKLSADAGAYDREAEEIEFRGNVVVTHGLGYHFRTEKAIVDIEEGRAFGEAPVHGYGPEGTLQGSGFEILDKGQTVKILGRSRLLITEMPEQF